MADGPMDPDRVRREAVFDRRSRWARSLGYAATTATAAADGRGGLGLRVGQVLVLHPATLATVGHITEPLSMVLVTEELVPFLTTATTEASALGWVECSAGWLRAAIDHLERQGRSHRL